MALHISVVADPGSASPEGTVQTSLRDACAALGGTLGKHRPYMLKAWLGSPALSLPPEKGSEYGNKRAKGAWC